MVLVPAQKALPNLRICDLAIDFATREVGVGFEALRKGPYQARAKQIGMTRRLQLASAQLTAVASPIGAAALRPPLVLSLLSLRAKLH